jgi:hypothetical protein
MKLADCPRRVVRLLGEEEVEAETPAQSPQDYHREWLARPGNKARFEAARQRYRQRTGK